MSVYSDKGGYTPMAMELGNEIHKALEPIINKYYDEGMTTEEIMYVVYGEAQCRCLMHQITKRQEERRKVKNEEENK